MPAHMLDRRGTGKAEKKTYGRRTDATTCLTCENGLSAKDQRLGCRRCATCREQTPGRPAVRRYADQQPKVTNRNKVPDIGSWWLGMNREQLNATAKSRFFVSPRRLVIDHGVCNGE